MKLDFVCLGAQKAGTTTLHDILNTHPDIYLPPRKEAHFFDVNERYEKGLNFYFSTFFNTYNGQKYIGNINPNLQIENRTIDRLIECFGKDIKIILILRNPVKRAYSHYLMTKGRGYENLTFVNALNSEFKRIKEPKYHDNYYTQELGHFEKNHLGYIYRSEYSRTLSYLFKMLPRENVKIIIFEEFVKDTKKSIRDILQFLGIPYSSKMVLDIRSNTATTYKNKLIWNFNNRPNYIKKFIGFFLTKRLKNYVIIGIIKLNTRKLNKNEKALSIKEYRFVYNSYFKKEIEKIEELMNMNLEVWKI